MQSRSAVVFCASGVSNITDGLHIHHHNYCVIICCPSRLCRQEIEEALKVLEKVKKNGGGGGKRKLYSVLRGKGNWYFCPICYIFLLAFHFGYLGGKNHVVCFSMWCARTHTHRPSTERCICKGEGLMHLFYHSTKHNDILYSACSYMEC